ncbi:hypothetical protein I7I51_04706 [Histoplasma capsulatum]|uniref:Uncharacterized protein n=1 Tax=Ajellomyces capsulatus TaxID=5037 RepID=A0A8A1M3I9_AJECA|nr:hypothetical protein I7I51_04706 [Histoplasma capsulatum]
MSMSELSLIISRVAAEIHLIMASILLEVVDIRLIGERKWPYLKISVIIITTPQITLSVPTKMHLQQLTSFQEPEAKAQFGPLEDLYIRGPRCMRRGRYRSSAFNIRMLCC